MANDIESRLAVCSWSLQPETPEALVAHLREKSIVEGIAELVPKVSEKVPQLLSGLFRHRAEGRQRREQRPSLLLRSHGP